MKVKTILSPVMVGLALWTALPAQSFAQLDASCMVSAFNRTAPVQADGVWVLPNIPANLGQVRVRATCVENGVVRFGASSLINVPVNGVLKVEDIDFQGPPPVPSSLMLSAPLAVLTAVGQTVQLSAIASYPGGATADVTAGDQGTGYRTSNPAIATVDGNGFVTARASGVALLSAVNEGALGVVRIQVVASGDSDGDGLPDDWELANGLDPNNPVDALDDQDGDGLSTITEYQAGLNPFNPDTDGDGLTDGREVNELGTNPLLGDTDGDGLWDGLEVQTGSDPLDPDSFNLAAALQGITVTPGSFTLIVNTIIGEASRQVQVVGQLLDGRSLDITASRYGTTYGSSDLTVASFGPEDGRVYAGQNGTATISVANNGFSGSSQVTVQTFAPTAIAWVDIPGRAKDVALAGDYAYVAAGDAGLQVVDISRLEAPAVVASLDTEGDAQEIVVVDGVAFLADGPGGLVAVDVSSPLAPQLLGQVATPGAAVGVAVAAGKVYVADVLGLRIVDAADPSALAIVGGVELPGKPNGVDVYNSLVVVACLNFGVRIVDVADPAAPVLEGSLNLWSGAAKVTLREHLAYVVAGGMTVVDFRVPSNPVAVQSSDWRGGFNFKHLALDRGFAVVPDLQTPNSIAILGISERPTLLAYMDLRSLSGGRGVYRHGLDVRDGVAFVTASSYPNQSPPPYSGLEIGRYALLSTGTGLPPVVRLVEPVEGAVLYQRNRLRIRAEAGDDGQIESVQFLVNGQTVFTDFAPPYEANIAVPGGSPQVRLRAVATDGEGNRSPSEELTFSVITNPQPVVALLAPVAGQSVSEGSPITLAADASDDVAVTRVEFLVNGAVVNTDFAKPYRYEYVAPFGVAQLEVRAVSYDNFGPSDPTPPVVIPVLPDLPPVVSVTEPRNGDPVVSGALFRVLTAAADDVRVTEVRLLVDGAVAATLAAPPFDFDVVAPLGQSEVRLAAVARDDKGQETLSEEVVVQIGGDPLTAAEGTVLLAEGGPAAGAAVICQGLGGTAGSDGRFSIAGIPTTTGRIRCRAQYTASDGKAYSGVSASVAAVRGGVTDMGEIQLRPEAAYLYPGPQLTVEADGMKVADLNADDIPDLVVGAPYFGGAAVFLGKPQGVFEPVRYFETAGSPTDVVIGDFNGDALPDIATANDYSYGVSVLLGNGDGTFQAHLDAPAGNRPVALAAGDFNGDGKLDLGVANKTSDTLSILLGSGDGTLTLAGTLPALDEPVAVEAGDVNQDGRLDLLSAQNASRNVKVFSGSGDGSFTLIRTINLGLSYPDDLAAADLNGDGRLDFATASEYGNDVKVFFGQPDGTYATGPVLQAGLDPMALVARDVDGNGTVDLATANNYFGEISLFPGNGNGSFGSPIEISIGASPNDIAAADLNQDGIGDLVTSNSLGISLVFGLGSSAYDTVRKYPAGSAPLGLTAGDWNGDGAQDLAVASSDSDEVAVLLGRGDGTFATEHRYPAGTGPVDVTAADFNGDGKLDLATADGSGDTLSVLLGFGDGTFAVSAVLPAGNYPTALLAADLNGDAEVDLVSINVFSDDVSVLLGRGDGTFMPQVRYLAGESPLSLARADFQGDGRLDLVTANDDSDDLSLLSGRGDGSFDAEVRVPLGNSPYPFPQSVAAADLNGDGKQDVVLNYLLDYSTYSYLHGVLLGNGDGTFLPLRTTPAGPNAFGLLLVADPNGDGIPDIVSTSPGGGATQDVMIVLGQGDGTFGAPQRYAAGCYPYYLVAADFNGDGQVDLATSNGCFDDETVSILLHH